MITKNSVLALSIIVKIKIRTFQKDSYDYEYLCFGICKTIHKITVHLLIDPLFSKQFLISIDIQTLFLNNLREMQTTRKRSLTSIYFYS